MGVEVLTPSRNGLQSDTRSGSLAESPGEVTFTLNGKALDERIPLAVGDTLLIEVQEHDATAADQPTPTRPAGACEGGRGWSLAPTSIRP